MEIDKTLNATFETTLHSTLRRDAGLITTRAGIRALLENEGSDGKPVVLLVAGVRSGNKPGRWFLREVRKVLIYESAAFLEVEKKRLAEEEKAAAEAARTARLNQIKGRLRAERKADDRDFDQRYNRQTEEQAAAAEAEIERKAAAILEEEEGK